MLKKRLTVIIPSYQASAALARSLPSLEKQSTESPFEVIVVDSSPDELVKDLCHGFSFVRLVHLKEKTLPGIARNRGAELATGDILVFLDADVQLHPNALQEIEVACQAGFLAFGGSLSLAAGSSVPAGRVEHLFFNHEAQAHRPQGLRKNLSSALMVVDRKVFMEFGGFRSIARMQDTELTERMYRAGVVLRFVPKVAGDQLQRSTWKDVIRKVYINGINLYFIRYDRKTNFLKRFALFLMTPLIVLLKSLRIVGRHLLYQDWKGRFLAFLLSPSILLLGVIWGLGFLRSIIFGGRISEKR